ncbi:MAG: hypothetical protein AN485_23065 [Anabaena sp. MDT14b]|nr:MAG: hypothetical protein AN485_23065 [Anabaena sp. MDT14b]
MVVRQIRFVPFRRQQELRRNRLGALVHELHEGVLSVGARLAPDHRAGAARHGRARQRHPLAVRFHVELLQIGRQPRQPLVIGQYRARGVAAGIAVPDADEAQQNGQVVGQRRGAEMLIHGMGAVQHVGEALRPDRQHHRQAHRRPQRVAAAYPVPEAEHPVRRDAEGGYLVERGRDGAEMRGHRLDRKGAG